jgi:divalent metal cation (Fe/Co/Zn/Cd) transporter
VIGWPAGSREVWSVCVAMADPRHSLISRALVLSYITIGWNGLTGVCALVLAIIASSPATAAFGLSGLLDSSASVVLVWRFRHEQGNPDAAEHVERRAQRFIVVAMFGVAMYVAVGALRALISGSHATESELAAVLAGLSLLVLPWLGRAKLVVAAALPSPALRGDAVLTIAAAALAGITLTALLLNSSFGWWWADPIAALVIACGLAGEGARVANRHAFG